MGSVVQGQALGGMFACATNVLCIATTTTLKWTAIYCIKLTWQNTFGYFSFFFPIIGGLAAVAAKFPEVYMGSVVQGQALGGMFACATNVLCIAVGATQEKTAIYCFLISILFLALSLAAYVFVTKTTFYRVCVGFEQKWKGKHLLL